MWKVIQELIPVLLIILLITQIVIPLLTNSKVFWLFRRIKSKSELTDEFKEAKEVVKQAKEKVNNIKEKANENLKTAKDLKDEADNLI